MASDTIFDSMANELEAATDLERLEARGTLRLALKEAGLDARSVDVKAMLVVLEKVLPKELRDRGVDSAESICSGLAVTLKQTNYDQDDEASTSPEAVFERLGGSSSR